jgi:hypothetical protein
MRVIAVIDEAIFQDDADRQRFVETLDQACVRTGCELS